MRYAMIFELATKGEPIAQARLSLKRFFNTTVSGI